jgi:hypothetical protein
MIDTRSIPHKRHYRWPATCAFFCDTIFCTSKVSIGGSAFRSEFGTVLPQFSVLSEACSVSPADA